MLWYTGKILRVASLIRSAFLVSIYHQHLSIVKYVTIAPYNGSPVCLLKRAGVGALGGENMAKRTWWS